MKKNLIVLFIVVILATIMYGIYSNQNTRPVACTLEALICPDGSAVGRIGPKCEFSPCPTIVKGKFCGGIAGILCPEGYDCKLDGNYPDAGGTCVKTGGDGENRTRVRENTNKKV